MKKIYTLTFILTFISAFAFSGNDPVSRGNTRGFISTDDPTVNIYPNPVKSFATISYTFDRVDKVSILNIVGKEVRVITFEPGVKETKVNLYDLQPGVYFLTATFQGQTLVTKKFLKEE
jgi:hypothetical protein